MRKLAALAALTASMASCFPQDQCSHPGPITDYCGAGDTTCQGHIIDATHWESGPMSGNWISFGRQEILLMHYRDAVTGQTLSGDVLNYQVLVGAAPNPDALGNSWDICGDDLCHLTDNDSSSLFVANPTCADYFVHVLVTLAPPTADAGTE